MRLDSTGVDLQQRGFIKIDVDGQGMEVLLSGTELLSKSNGDVLVKNNSPTLERECVGLLERHGYTCSVIDNAWWRFIVPEQRPIPRIDGFSAIKAVCCSPAKENGAGPGRKMCHGSLQPRRPGSWSIPKKPSAGIRQRFDLNASLKEPDVSTVSARALLGRRG